MIRTVTRNQVDDLEMDYSIRLRSFPAKLEEYTGITAKPCTVYQYFDEVGNYIGDSNDMSVCDLLAEAGIEVVDDE